MTAASSFHDEPQPTEPAREIVPFGDAIRQAAYEAVPQAKFIASVFDPIADACARYIGQPVTIDRVADMFGATEVEGAA